MRRFRNGKRVPPQLQRMDAEDLVAVAFPDQLACLENIQGDREIPDHPLVRQMAAGLTEARQRLAATGGSVAGAAPAGGSVPGTAAAPPLTPGRLTSAESTSPSSMRRPPTLT